MFARFLNASAPQLREVDLSRLTPDQELKARYLQRIEEKKAELGRNWVGHQKSTYQYKPPVSDVRTTILRAQAALNDVRRKADVRRLRAA